MKDFYAILGTDINCSVTEINEAYEKLSEKFRPELDAGDLYFQKRFKDIREAYEVLSDPARRSNYNEELKRAKPDPVNEKRKIKKYHSSPKGLNMALTFILAVLTIIFGAYVIKTLSGAKTPKVPQISTVKPVAFYKVKHHRKRRIAKVKTISNASKAVADTVKTHQVQSLPVSNIRTYTENKVTSEVKSLAEPQVKEERVIKKEQIETKADYLYTTYVKANQTGVIHMRRQDSYNSDIIKVIPTNSQVFVLEKGDHYYKVMFENAVGYIPRWTVQVK